MTDYRPFFPLFPIYNAAECSDSKRASLFTRILDRKSRILCSFVTSFLVSGRGNS
jgi:hypothetical protein